MHRGKRGFTLIETMVVLAIVSVVVAISIPNLLRSRISANEASAQETLRAVNAALESYYLAQIPHTYPPNLAALSNANPPYLIREIANNTLTSSVTSTVLSESVAISRMGGYKGYVFRYQPVGPTGQARNYNLFAAPVGSLSGARSFSISATGQILESCASAVTGGAGAC